MHYVMDSTRSDYVTLIAFPWPLTVAFVFNIAWPVFSYPVVAELCKIRLSLRVIDGKHRQWSSA